MTAADARDARRGGRRLIPDDDGRWAHTMPSWWPWQRADGFGSKAGATGLGAKDAGVESLYPWLDLTAACGVRSGRLRDSDRRPCTLERAARDGRGMNHVLRLRLISHSQITAIARRLPTPNAIFLQMEDL